jgi:flagellin
MSDAFLPSPTDPIVAPQPAVPANWAARRLGQRPYDAALMQDHGAKSRRDGKREDDPPAEPGATVMIPRRLRSSVPALTCANADLARAQGLLLTTLTGLNRAVATLGRLRALSGALDGRATPAEKPLLRTHYAAELATLRACFTEAGYHRHNLLSDFSDARADFGSWQVLADAAGHTMQLSCHPASDVYGRVSQASATIAPVNGQQNDDFVQVTHTLSDWIHELEAEMNDINRQISDNSQQIDTLSQGIGSLVDVDLAAEAARLKALQIQQQLQHTSASLGGAPSTLVALFK